MTLVAAIAATDPDLSARDIAAKLERMRERTLRGGIEWNASSVKQKLERPKSMASFDPPSPFPKSRQQTMAVLVKVGSNTVMVNGSRCEGARSVNRETFRLSSAWDLLTDQCDPRQRKPGRVPASDRA